VPPFNAVSVPRYASGADIDATGTCGHQVGIAPGDKCHVVHAIAYNRNYMHL
jgi:hypothetical protein